MGIRSRFVASAAVGVAVLGLGLASAVPASAYSVSTRDSGQSGNCMGYQWILTGYNGSAHDYQQGYANQTGVPDVCRVTISQWVNGQYVATSDTTFGPGYGSTGTWYAGATAIYYDGPGYQDQVCVYDLTRNTNGWCSTLY